jgi:GTP pyrophosphokinase
MGVASLVFEFGGTEDEVIAALLHDVIEDGGAEWVSIIETNFGIEVLRIVRECSDSEPGANQVKPPWRARKTAYVSSIPKKSSSALLVTACDKLHNLTAILRDYREHGNELWSRFNAGPEEIYWYYSQLMDQFQTLGAPPANELRLKCDELQKIVQSRLGVVVETPSDSYRF